MEEEMALLNAMGTFKAVPLLPLGKNLVGVKWVLTIKKGTNGKPVRYKACLAVLGFSQRYSIRSEETFLPVMRIERLQLLLWIGA